MKELRKQQALQSFVEDVASGEDLYQRAAEMLTAWDRYLTTWYELRDSEEYEALKASLTDEEIDTLIAHKSATRKLPNRAPAKANTGSHSPH